MLAVLTRSYKQARSMQESVERGLRARKNRCGTVSGPSVRVGKEMLGLVGVEIFELSRRGFGGRRGCLDARSGNIDPEGASRAIGSCSDVVNYGKPWRS
jgi:hypothetical protein